mgnify:CR=1 FL=1
MSEKIKLQMATTSENELNVEFSETDIEGLYGMSVNKLMHTVELRSQFIAIVITKAKQFTDLTIQPDDQLDVSFFAITSDRYNMTIKKKRQQIAFFQVNGSEVEKVMDTVDLEKYGLKEKISTK